MAAQGFGVRAEVVARQKDRLHRWLEWLQGIAQGHPIDSGEKYFREEDVDAIEQRGVLKGRGAVGRTV